jgi:hypothetical protein
VPWSAFGPAHQLHIIIIIIANIRVNLPRFNRDGTLSVIEAIGSRSECVKIVVGVIE